MTEEDATHSPPEQYKKLVPNLEGKEK